MRLLEPLNGLKMVQGHFFSHLMYFVFMFFISRNIDGNSPIKVSHDGISLETKDSHHLTSLNLQYKINLLN